MVFLLGLVVLWLALGLWSQSARVARLQTAVRGLDERTAHLTQRISGLEMWLGWGPRLPAPYDRSAGAPSHSGMAIPKGAPPPSPQVWPPAWEPMSPDVVAVAADTSAAASAAAATHAVAAAQVDPQPSRPAIERTNEVAAPVAPGSTTSSEGGVDPRPAIDWERWLGVRGAAAMGAAILVVALLYFLRYSMDSGWLTPTLRVVLGAGCSAACLAVAQLSVRRGHPTLGSWMTGAGVAGLFASVWAAQHIVGLVGPVTAFVATVAITIGCVAIALKEDSLPIALLGLAGGFAAPMSIYGGADNPYAAMAYVALLDVAMVGLSLRKQWWALAILSMLASAGYHVVWTAQRGDGAFVAEIGIVLVFAAVFGALPALAPSRVSAREGAPEGLAIATSYGAVVLSYAFLLQLTTNASDVGLSIAGLLLILEVLALVLARKHRQPALSILALLGSVLVSLSWMATAPDAATTCALQIVTCAPFAVAALLDRTSAQAWLATAAAGLGAVVILVAAFITPASIVTAPTLLILAAVVVALGRVTNRPAYARRAPLGLGAALGLVALASLSNGRDVPAAVWICACLGLGGALAVARISRDCAPWSDALLSGIRQASVLLIAAVLPHVGELALLPYAGLVGVFGTFALLAGATKTQSYGWLAVTSGGALALHGHLHASGTASTLWIAAFFVTGLLAAPFIAKTRELEWTPRGQTIVIASFSLAVFPSAGALRDLSPLAVGVVSSGASLALFVAASRGAQRERAGRWLGGAALVFAAFAVAMGLSDEHQLWGWAALGASAIVLDRRFAITTFAVGGALLLVGGVVGLFDPAVLALHPRSALPIVSWHTPAYLVPGAMSAVAFVATRRSALRRLAAVTTLVVVFLWANVCVLDVFATGRYLSLPNDPSQARDLTLSLVWGLYGVGLLVLGLRRSISAIRWASLALVLVTAAKVFLYDLANLGDLYRVGALLGLALSLIVISVLYQRFVLRRPSTPASTRS